MRTSETTYRLLALAFVGAAIFHALALGWPGLAEPAASRSHALFVLINAALAAGARYRPRGFVLVFALFTLEQLVSHGRSGYLIWRDQHRLDWASLVTVVFVPSVLALLLRDAKRRRQP